jgi:plasmid stabilization system protein ParE
MSYVLFVEPEAEAEIDEASQWYEANSRGLGTDFLRAVDGAPAAIQRNPLQHQIVHGVKRRAGLRRFPCGLFYIVFEQEIVVLACIHGRRNPRRWQD